MLLVLSTIRSPLIGGFFILMFGLGSILGMLTVSALREALTRVTAT